jgi:hypothetical protein
MTLSALADDLTVLHRLFVSGSDRAADRWREDYAIVGVEGLDLQHLYRAMAWLGEELSADGRTPFSPRCVKDEMEQPVFAYRRDLFARLDLVFMDTMSLYFECANRQQLFCDLGVVKSPDVVALFKYLDVDAEARQSLSQLQTQRTGAENRYGAGKGG